MVKAKAVKSNRPTKAALDSLAAEMAVPQITTSALTAMRNLAHAKRKLGDKPFETMLMLQKEWGWRTMESDRFGATSSGTEYVADILERELDATIDDWMRLVGDDAELIRIPLNFEERTGHLPRLLRDVIARLRLDEETKAAVSVAASHHGILRRRQGYTVAMLVDESRILQVCIFSTLHKKQKGLGSRKLLADVAVIADEVDAQLKQQVLCFG